MDMRLLPDQRSGHSLVGDPEIPSIQKRKPTSHGRKISSIQKRKQPLSGL
ncbi:MAG: hypothetical protein LUG98_13605 [Tannerellaceae bacterium]|nr:hypothetical protein [Tannerellaceae bacterium]